VCGAVSEAETREPGGARAGDHGQRGERAGARAAVVELASGLVLVLDDVVLAGVCVCGLGLVGCLDVHRERGVGEHARAHEDVE
jgi:hypothetical protein